MTNKTIIITSGNQTWHWNMDHLSVIFPLKPPFIRGSPLPCLIARGYWLSMMVGGVFLWRKGLLQSHWIPNLRDASTRVAALWGSWCLAEPCVGTWKFLELNWDLRIFEEFDWWCAAWYFTGLYKPVEFLQLWTRVRFKECNWVYKEWFGYV